MQRSSPTIDGIINCRRTFGLAIGMSRYNSWNAMAAHIGSDGSELKNPNNEVRSERKDHYA